MTRRVKRNSPRPSGAAKNSQRKTAKRDISPDVRFKRTNPRNSKYGDIEDEEEYDGDDEE